MLKSFSKRFLACLALLLTSAYLAGSGLAGGSTIPLATQEHHKVSLSWKSVPSVEGYYVYRGQKTGGPYPDKSALQPVTSFIDKTVESGHTYYYVVTSLTKGEGESGYSDEVQAVIPTH